jgi:transcriptional antiterminator RfaH
MAQEQWYLLRCKPREDSRAEGELLNQEFTVFRPVIAREKLVRRKKKTVIESLFPGYIFINLSDSNDSSTIQYTRGVIGFVRFGGYPTPVDHSVVSRLKARVDGFGHAKNTPLALFSEKAKLAITSGPLKGLEGIFQKETGDERVILLLNFMQKQQTVQVPLDAVKAV